jgi:TP901 family phage tail tape measure protein
MAKQRILKVTIAGDAKSLGAAFGAAETRAQQFAAKMKSVAKVGSAALIGIGAVSVKSFAGFDDAMTKSLSIMGDVSDAQRDRMVKAAREMAKQSTFSAEQAAESYFFLASAGLSAEQSIAALPQVTKFAQAGAFDLALATDLLTDAQSALGLSSDDTATSLRNMAKVGDVLVKANTLANASVQQFSEALTTKAGAALKAVGKDIEEGVAVLAVFADQGIKGAEAGTALGIVMRDLQTKAIKNKEAWEQLGVAAFDANGEMRNIADIIGGLETALAGMSDQQQKATLLQLGFSDKSVSFITALLGSSDAIRTYEAALRDAGGITQEVADKQLESATAKFKMFMSEVQDLGLTFGEALVPRLLDAVEGIKSVAQWFSDLGPASQVAIAAVGGVAAALALVHHHPIIAGLTVVGGLVAAIGHGSRERASDIETLADALKELGKPRESIIREFLSDTDLRTLDALGITIAEVADLLTSGAFRNATDDIGPTIGELIEKFNELPDATKNAFSISSGDVHGLVDALTTLQRRRDAAAESNIAAAQAERAMHDAMFESEQLDLRAAASKEEYAQATHLAALAANEQLMAQTEVTEYLDLKAIGAARNYARWQAEAATETAKLSVLLAAARDRTLELTAAREGSGSAVFRLFDAASSLAGAQERVNALEAEGKTATSEYQEAVLDLLEAQGRHDTAVAGVAASSADAISAIRILGERAGISADLIEILVAAIEAYIDAANRAGVGTTAPSTFEGGGDTNIGGILEGFHSGGVVPGPRGQDRLVLAAGGETILPTHRPGFKTGGGATVEVHVGTLVGSDGMEELAVILQREVARMAGSGRAF